MAINIWANNVTSGLNTAYGSGTGFAPGDNVNAAKVNAAIKFPSMVASAISEKFGLGVEASDLDANTDLKTKGLLSKITFDTATFLLTFSGSQFKVTGSIACNQICEPALQEGIELKGSVSITTDQDGNPCDLLVAQNAKAAHFIQSTIPTVVTSGLYTSDTNIWVSTATFPLGLYWVTLAANSGNDHFTGLMFFDGELHTLYGNGGVAYFINRNDSDKLTVSALDTLYPTDFKFYLLLTYGS